MTKPVPVIRKSPSIQDEMLTLEVDVHAMRDILRALKAARVISDVNVDVETYVLLHDLLEPMNVDVNIDLSILEQKT